MQKFTFTVDVVSNSSVDHETVRGLLARAVDGLGDYHAVSYDGNTSLAEQGLKVWAKRRAGISLAAPKPVKVKKVKVETETAAS